MAAMIVKRPQPHLFSYPRSYMGAKIHQLPAELTIRVLEIALLVAKTSTISTISKTLHEFINDILYRVVVLDSEETIRHFHRTAKANNVDVLSRVKKLVVVWQPEKESLKVNGMIRDIITACSYIHHLEISTLNPNAIPDMSKHHNLADLTTQFLELGAFEGRLSGLHPKLTHLRLAEPPEAGRVLQPGKVLEEFGNPSHLTHLQLSRRTHANEDNDLAFVEDIRTILQLNTYSSLKMLVVSIFNGESWRPEPITESHIWGLLDAVSKIDDRVVLVEGQKGEWGEGWKGYSPCDGMKIKCWSEFSPKTYY
ncbi:hypothetical protein FA15DRAFT_670771 [Coprinopsis marcescibilis]|uniref:F-box domain-containing protein n=1 Tax=Coprinopsis marcescibilis TaxID=230819 RepID=A0A5C3KRH4_COPMA|nr:hypothetical protein FA15DRAFT_670771 [Coprinopsis marcescibilis]